MTPANLPFESPLDGPPIGPAPMVYTDRSMSTYVEGNSADVLSLLRRSDLCEGLSDEDIRQVAEAARPVSYAGGEVIHRQNQHGHAMYIVAKGRVQLTVERGGLDYHLLEYLGRGQHFGEMAVLTDGRHMTTASAAMDCDLLELPQADFQRLMITLPRFAANLSRSLGFRLRWHTSGKRARRKPKVVGLVSSTLRTQRLLDPLARELAARGESVEVLTDRTEGWPTGGEYRLQRLPGELPDSQKPAVVRARLAHAVEHHDRLFLDFTQRKLETLLPALLSQCEEIWWLAESRFADSARRNLATLLSANPRLASRTRVIWILSDTELFSPGALSGLGVDDLGFKVVIGDEPGAPTRNESLGIQRLANHLRGTRVGVALGGGGARGMAHLGVLKGLERAGICIDLMAGTSSGALMGVSYAGGWPAEKAVEEFCQALVPNRLFRSIPGGNHWYLWFKFRTGAWERMLRPYLGHATLEQLQIPISTVATDLVSGRSIVRDRGDIVNAVLESINIPAISRPILRDGQALVDGGVLNNLPSDILPARGADVVIGVDVVARLRHAFAGNSPDKPTEQMARPGLIETLLRVYEVQNLGLNETRTGPVDLMITPDTSAFEFADFRQGRQIAEVGEASALEAAPQIKQILADMK
jgi:predicted acylesterase/phospholipase RssA/CRP-like cAMP-binding protein